MKKYLAMFVALCLLCTSVIAVSCIVSSADSELNVRVINDFENDTVTITHETPGSYTYNYSTDEKYSGRQSYDITGTAFSEGETVINNTVTDWTNAKYLQFWVKNDSDGPVSMEFLALWGAEKWALKSNYSVQLYNKSTGAWDSVTTGSKDDFSLPQSYEGFVRVPLEDDAFTQVFHGGDSAFALTSNLNNISKIDFYLNNQDGTNTNFYIDDIALVGNNMPTLSGVTDVSESTYFNIEPVVRVINDFEDENVTITHETPGSYTYNYSTDEKYSGSQSYDIKGTAFSEGETVINNTVTDWTNAKYLQFWVKNDSDGPVSIAFLALWGAEKWVLKSNYSVQLYNKSTGAWDSVTTGSKDDFSLPKSYEGFVRVPLEDDAFTQVFHGGDSAFALTSNLNNISKIDFYLNNQDGTNTNFYIDDIALVGNNMPTLSGVTDYLESDYLSAINSQPTTSSTESEQSTSSTNSSNTTTTTSSTNSSSTTSTSSSVNSSSTTSTTSSVISSNVSSSAITSPSNSSSDSASPQTSDNGSVLIFILAAAFSALILVCITVKKPKLNIN